MRFMVIVKATEDSEAGMMPSEELLTAMMKYNEELVKAGIMLAGDGLQPTSKGVASPVRWAQAHRRRRPLRRDQGTDRRLLDLAGPLARRSDRMGQALPQPDARPVRDRDPPSL